MGISALKEALNKIGLISVELLDSSRHGLVWFDTSTTFFAQHLSADALNCGDLVGCIRFTESVVRCFAFGTIE